MAAMVDGGVGGSVVLSGAIMAVVAASAGGVITFLFQQLLRAQEQRINNLQETVKFQNERIDRLNTRLVDGMERLITENNQALASLGELIRSWKGKRATDD